MASQASQGAKLRPACCGAPPMILRSFSHGVGLLCANGNRFLKGAAMAGTAMAAAETRTRTSPISPPTSVRPHANHTISNLLRAFMRPLDLATSAPHPSLSTHLLRARKQTTW